MDKEQLAAKAMASLREAGVTPTPDAVTAYLVGRADMAQEELDYMSTRREET